MKRLTLPSLFLLALLLAAGCDRSERPSQKETAARPDGEKIFAIGLIPEQNIFKQMDRYQPIASSLSKRVGIKIRLTVLPRYGNIIDYFVSSGLDGAFFGSFTYALAHRKLGIEPLARPMDMSGASTYHGILFVRKDGDIKSVNQMKGKRFAFVDKATTAGYLLPLAYFKENGKDYRTFLKETYFTGTHEDAVMDVLNGKADIGAAKNTVYERLAASDERIKKELTILDRSPDVPENSLAVRRDLDRSLKKKLKEALLTLGENPVERGVLAAFGAQRFIETTDADYQVVYRYAQEIELDLATYDYMNDR
jgi:phosphonate transport system substrate-binding protein